MPRCSNPRFSIESLVGKLFLLQGFFYFLAVTAADGNFVFIDLNQVLRKRFNAINGYYERPMGTNKLVMW